MRRRASPQFSGPRLDMHNEKSQLLTAADVIIRIIRDDNPIPARVPALARNQGRRTLGAVAVFGTQHGPQHLPRQRD